MSRNGKNIMACNLVHMASANRIAKFLSVQRTGKIPHVRIAARKSCPRNFPLLQRPAPATRLPAKVPVAGTAAAARAVAIRAD